MKDWTASLYFVTRWNWVFQCPEYRSRKHSGWTLHADLAQGYRFAEAEAEHRLHERATIADAA